MLLASGTSALPAILAAVGLLLVANVLRAWQLLRARRVLKRHAGVSTGALLTSAPCTLQFPFFVGGNGVGLPVCSLEVDRDRRRRSRVDPGTPSGSLSWTSAIAASSPGGCTRDPAPLLRRRPELSARATDADHRANRHSTPNRRRITERVASAAMGRPAVDLPPQPLGQSRRHQRNGASTQAVDETAVAANALSFHMPVDTSPATAMSIGT